MNEYLVAKWIHVLSSTILFGTGIGSAYYMLVASLGRDPREVHAVVRHVVRADWLFTTPAVIVQPLTGLWLAHLAGFPLSSPWLLVSIALYLLAGACWLPVVWMQIRMREMAREAVEQGVALPDRYFACLRKWIALGGVAFVSLVVVFYLMVAKPG
jgi:uncharacterized membrane protein